MGSTTGICSPERRLPLPLPKEWSDWGKNAVYFVSITYSYNGTGGEAISVYAINTDEESLPVYHVMDFPCGPGICKASEAACAVKGSRAYVVAGQSMWFRDIGGRSDIWEVGRLLNGRIVKPKLFTLRGRLYALDSVLLYKSPEYNFQVLFKKSWLSLDDPPRLFPTKAEFKSVRDCTLRGLTCIGDSKVILHVSTAKAKERYLCEVSFKQHFLCFRITDDCDGEWSILEVRLSESCIPNPFPEDVYSFYRSHLHNDDPLLLPIVAEKLHAIGLSVSPDTLHLEYVQEVDTSNPELDREWRKNTMRIWNILHVAGGRYCAIAFPQSTDPRESCRGGFFVFSFNFAGQPGAQKNAEVDGSSASASSSKLTIEHVYQFSGVQHPLPLLSGLAGI